ncbi:glycosyltransferase [Roseomonas marmotae]|uniref:Glycosyltransferase family 4 protein n=1 Tax=Roseomonas marmotae TaxID=2768161 RepID=A0ABS3KHB0_9PROT|nr:glycosyltransferase [Roseomonas marmotae]MBO1076868.1 glycosyltransferase family 4 protein [Roseomonas marmotae]QTI81119.1 glycosyltransferase family 4 protein [Roseomonas marmotae]
MSAPSTEPAGQPRIFLTTDAVGGVWTYALDLARGSSARGMAITLAVLGPPASPAQMAEAGSIPGCRLLPTGLPLDWAGADAATLRAAGRALAALAAEEGAELVHLNSPALAAHAGFAAPLVIGCHSCVATWWHTVRGTALPPDFAWQRDLVAAGYHAAKLLVAPSASFARMTERLYDLPVPPRVVHNGRAARSPTPAAASREGILAAGRLWDEAKNIALLDRIAPRLAIPIEVAGPLVAPHGGTARLTKLRHLGLLGAEEMAHRFAAAGIFVSPARYEPFGLAVLEAAQAGCALLLSDIPSFREIWGDAADYAAPDDEAGFLEGLHRLSADAALRARRGAAAQQRAARYSGDAMVEGMIALYRDMLPQRIRLEAAA